MDAGCASSIEAIESGEARAPELAHVATLEFRLGAWTSALAIAANAEPSALSVGHNVGKRDSPVRAALGLLKGPIATAGDRIARGWLAGVDTGEHREGSQNLPPTRVRWRSGWPSKASS